MPAVITRCDGAGSCPATRPAHAGLLKLSSVGCPISWSWKRQYRRESVRAGSSQEESANLFGG
jgi:hypothetical protein